MTKSFVEMGKQLKFLFVPIEAVGHFNACIGVGQQLLARKHEVHFATPISWEGKLEPHGFIEEPFQDPSGPRGSNFGKIVVESKDGLGSAMGQLATFQFAAFQDVLQTLKNDEKGLKEVMRRVKPDCVIIDNLIQSPALTCQGVPWVLLLSINPVSTSPENVPPGLTGYPIMDGDKALWDFHRQKTKEVFRDLFQDYKKWMSENGGPEPKWNYPFWTPHSPYANIYMYPQELSYTMFRPDPPKWHRFEAFVRTETGQFEIPQELKNLPGKLIYFSMGTIGCSDVDLMRKLIGFLKHSPHRFLVSKGPLGDEIDLPGNMWGQKSLPQTKILPLVDLAITHGGNNTITESFYFGTRVLVLPLFGDQLDNGQRVQETGMGLSFKPYHVTQEELLGGIEKLLADELLERRMKTISRRIQGTNSQEQAAVIVENVAMNNKSKH